MPSGLEFVDTKLYGHASIRDMPGVTKVQPGFLTRSRSEAAQGGVMAGARDRVNASQRAALGGRSRELVRNPG